MRLPLDLRAGIAMAILRPLVRNIGKSFGMSPIVAISARGMDKNLESVVTTVPLLASRWVTSTA